MTIEEATEIMGKNMVGPREIRAVEALSLLVKEDVPEIPFSQEELKKKKENYLLFLGVSHFSDGRSVTIRHLIDIFGKDPDHNEPCFYNQDWYEKEDFIHETMDDEWFLIRKNVFDESRAVIPEKLMKEHTFPSAIQCAYAFFMTWLVKGVILWEHDFVWCRDTDHNGDRIYIGRYHDIDGVNKNGFNIHRHLSLRSCYGCVDVN